MTSDPETPAEQRPLRADRPEAARLPYDPARLVHLGSFRELTKGGGLTGDDIGAPFGTRPG
ncbi:hypothetical protein [Lamprocystis purpurea]|jgi:hypothetical protein|uniref:hypothetical protein n=1 Tax=Lamprocystis purpurea TaxID=61598 RepID=UPI001B7FB3E2|nr:hypothetical protein [Lamprocystis purpurea]